MFEYNGKEYTLAQVEAAASTANLSLDEYIKKASLTTIEPGKTTPTTPDAVVEETAASDQPSMELDSVDTSLELQPGEQGYYRQEKRKERSAKESEQDKSNWERFDFLDDVGQRLKISLKSIEQGITRIPTLINEVKFSILKPFLSEEDQEKFDNLNAEEQQAFVNRLGSVQQQAMASIGLPTIPVDAQKSLEKSEEARIKLEDLESELVQFENTIGQDIADGNLGRSVTRTASQAIGAIPSLVQALIPYVGISSIVAGEAAKASGEAQRKGEDIGLKTIGYSSVIGASEGLLEIFTKKLGKNVFKSLVNSPKEVVEKNIKDVVLNVSKSAGGEGLSESGTLTINKMADAVILKDEKAFDNYMLDLVDTFIVGAAVGGPLRGTGEAGGLLKNAAEARSVNKELKESQYENLTEAFKSPIVDEGTVKLSENKFTEKFLDFDLKQKLNSGDITTEEAAKIKTNFTQTQAAVNSLKPLNLSTTDRAEVIELSKEKKSLENTIKQVDDKALTEPQDKRVKEINELLRGYSARAKVAETAKVGQAISQLEKVGIQTLSTEEIQSYLQNNNLVKNQEDAIKKSSEGAFIVQNPDTQKQEIIVNKDIGSISDPSHEALHALIFQTVRKSPDTARRLGESLQEQLNKVDSNLIEDSGIRERLELYNQDPTAVQMEEVLTLFSDTVRNGTVKFNDNTFTKIGDFIRQFLSSLGVKAKFNNGRDVYNFIKDYNKSIESGKLTRGQVRAAKEGVRGKLVGPKIETFVETPTIKESRSQEASDRVQKIYDEQGMSGAFDIIEEFKPITLKITRKRREAPNYDEELLSSEIEIGQGGLLDLIKSYKPESGVPLAAYINKNLPLRAIAASKRILGEQFTEDVTELRDVAVQEEISRKEEMEEREIAEEIKSLRKQIGLSEDLVARTKDAVMKTFGTKLPSPEDPKFKLALQTAFRVELKKPMAKFVGKQADYENFLRDNFEVIYNKLTINTIAKRFRDFAEPVIDEKTGKQAREKTDEGNKIFKKKNITKAEFIAYFLGSNVGRSTQGTRKTAIVEAVAEEIAFDATMEVLRDPMVTERYLQISELIGDPLPENFKSLIAKQIDRGENFKFSKSISNISKNEYGLDTQELAKILDNTNYKTLSNKYSLISDNIIYEAEPTNIKFSLSSRADSKWEQNALNPLSEYDKKYNFSVGEVDYQISIISVKDAQEETGEAYDYEIFEGSYGLEDDAITNDPKSVILAFATESGRTGITGASIEKRTNAFKVFGIVGNSVIDLVKKDNLNSITFTAKEESRQRLYQSLSNKFAEELGWEIYDFFNDDGGLSFLVYDPKITSEESVVLNTPSIKFSKSKDYQFTAKDVLNNAKAWRNFTNKHFEQSKIYQEKIGNISRPGGSVRPSNIIKRDVIKDFGKLSSEEKKIVEAKIEKHRLRIINYKTKNKKSIRPENIYYKSPATAYGKNYELIKENIKNGKIFELNEAYSKIYTDMWIAYFEILEENPDMYDFLEMSLQTSNNDVAHWQRLGARFTGFDPQAQQEILKNKEGKTIYRFTTKTGKKIPILRTYEFEHAVQNHLNWAKNLDLARKLSKKENGKELYIKEIEKAKENYTLFALSVSDARKVDKAGYSLKMPENWKTFLDRYFNPKVAKIDGGIDTEKISIIKYENSKAIVDDSTVKSVYNINNDGSKLKYSKSAKTTEFNKIIERGTGFKTRTKLAEVKADKLAKNKGKFRFFIPPSADDFAGLLYYITGKGKQGNADMQYFKETFFDPFAKGIAKFDESKQKALANFKQLKKLIRKTPARLSKQNETGFTNEEVARIYIWNSLGYDIPGLTKKDIKEAVKFVKNNNELLEFAQNVKGISVLGYPKPDNGWVAGTMTTDLLSYVNETVRADFLKDWKTNVDATLKKPDVLNKLKATYGENYTEALEDILYRMETGRHRPMGSNKLTNQLMNWINNSVGAIMFFNTRSALLQQLSLVNFINFSDNNPLAVAKTIGNQKQFWKDYSMLMNSDFLKQRRSGLKTDVNADEIAKAAEGSKNPMAAAFRNLLKAGFLPTQIADSHAIAVGGASFYRNRLNRYLAEGMEQAQAEEQTFLDFQEIAEETQQSSRPDRISMQQASPLGRIILAFANTPMQYARLSKKAALDLINKRGDWKTNMSKLMYYTTIQNIIFSGLQSAAFAMMFDDETEEEEKDRYYRIANSTADSLLRGLGFGGAAVAAGKNMILEAINQAQSKRPDYEKAALKALSLSPPIDSKMRKFLAAGRAFTYKQTLKKMRTEGFSLDNPAFEATGQIISATTNLPADRVVRKLDNLSTPVRQDVETWQAISLALGYSKWDVGLIESQAKKPKKSTTGLKTKKLKTKKLK